MLPIDVLRHYPPHAQTLWTLLKSRAAARPEHAFIEFQQTCLSYAAALERVERVAALLSGRGVVPGDRIAVMCFNHPDVAIILIALARLGAIMVPVNPEYGVEEARYVLTHAGVRGIVCASAAVSTVASACASLHPAPWLMVNDENSPGPAIFADELRRVETPAPPVVDDPDCTCLLIYTSGTTGFPKGVMHSQRSAVLGGEAFVERMHLQVDDRMLCILPMFHMNALFYSLCGTLAAGATLIVAARFSASNFWKLAFDTRATEVNTIAAISNILIQRPRTEFVAGHVLRKIYGAPFSAQIYQVFNNEFQVPVLVEGYGMTEIPGVLNNLVDEAPRIGSMGVLARHPDHGMQFSEVRIINDAGAEVTDCDVGEITVRTPIIMKGYYADPEQTAAAFRDGWFLTGDLGYRDASGYYWFVARKKDIIRKRGENISGAELDRVIGEHPDILETAAIAVPSALGEDDILVAIVRRPGTTVSAEQIIGWSRSRLAPIKVPRYITFVDTLPHTPTHRVAKYRMRDDRTLLEGAVDFG